MDPASIWYDTCIQIILSLTFACEFWCVYHELLGKLKSGTVLTSVSSTFLPYVWGFGNIFAKTNHSFYFSIGSLMLLTVYIYPHQGIASFHPTSRDSLCGAYVGEAETCTSVTYIGKANIRSMEMKYNRIRSRLRTCVEGRLWKWNFLSFFGSCLLGMPSFNSFLFF